MVQPRGVVRSGKLVKSIKSSNLFINFILNMSRAQAHHQTRSGVIFGLLSLYLLSFTLLQCSIMFTLAIVWWFS